MTVTSSAHATMDAARAPRAAKRRRLVGALLLAALLLAAAWALRDAAAGKRTDGVPGRTRTYLLPRAEWGFGADNHAITSYVQPIHSGDTMNVTQRDTHGKVIWQHRFVSRKRANGFTFVHPAVRAARVRNVAIVCNDKLVWGVSGDPVRRVHLNVPARRVRLGFFAHEAPQGTVEVK